MPLEPSHGVDERWAATIAAALLRRGAAVHLVSVTLALGALLGGAALGLGPRLPWLVAGTVVVVAGAIEFWLALRVGFDADLFAALATRDNGLEPFDRAMTRLGLVPAAKTSRTLAIRIAAAFRLLRLQAVATGVQVVALVAATLGAAGWPA